MPDIQIFVGKKNYQFEAHSDQNILDQALGAGVPVASSCRRGDCGQCASRLVSGDVKPLDPCNSFQFGDDILLCNISAQSDLLIQIPYFAELERIRVRRIPAKIHALNRLSKKVIKVSLRFPPGQSFDFLPGQFIRLTKKGGVTRSYSLADCPREDNIVHIHVRRVEGGVFSHYLFDGATEGDLVHVEGPQGHFFVRSDDHADKTIFLATGTGIAPILAILQGLSEEQRLMLGHLSVYWGNQRREDEYLYDELCVLKKKLSFEYWPVFSREISGGVKYVQDLMASHHKDMSNALVFACGSAAMIESARKVCRALRLPEDNLRSDAFTQS